MTREEFLDLVRSKDNPLLKQEPMVTQLWQDGEVTAQKGGDLLWQRTLHMDMWAVPGAKELGLEFPHGDGTNSYIWCTREDAMLLREGIKELVKRMLETIP